jgi:hypothetical protein
MMAMLLGCWAWAAAALPPPPPSITVGDIRVQALSADVVRVERRGPRGFEDSPTFLVQQRDLGAGAAAMGEPRLGADGSFSVCVGAGAEAVLVRVKPAPRPAARCFAMANIGLSPTRAAGPSLHAADEGACCDACDANANCTSWLYSGPAALGAAAAPPPPPPPASCCAAGSQLRDTDVAGPSVIKAVDPAQCNATLAACCKLCDASAPCAAFVLAPPSSWSACPEMPYCFLLKGYKATKRKAGSIVGRKGGAPGPPPTPPPRPPARDPNCQLNSGYGEQHLGRATFGCPRRGCDATWSGRWQGGDLGRSFRQPPLGMHASVHDAATGELLGTSDDASAPFNFPAPSSRLALEPGVFAVRDAPRFLVPRGGAIPQADVAPALANTSGYDIRNDADDVYLFLTRANYTGLKLAFTAVTGPVPLLPDWAFGAWFTEWHNYSQSVAEAEQRRWQTHKLPLSVWGLDINWRLNGFGCGKGGNCCTAQLPGDSCEYYYNQTNTTRIPNITGLFAFEHALGLRVYLNDHPHGWQAEASPFEVEFRYDGLTSYLARGLDYWWYDPNWHVGIAAPFNLEGHMWGAHVYTSILAHYNAVTPGRVGRRPLMLGISDAMHPAAHRYPVWWTGDDKGLGTSINTMVEFGVRHLKPYVHSDCGGVADKQTGLVDVPEYVRWSQHCALGAIHRYHGGPGHQPWLYGDVVEGIVRDFLNMRMRLMPTIIAAAARATLDATPVVRRLDLAYPTAGANATRTDQYLLGDDILVAPFSGGWSHNGSASREVWIPPGGWVDAWTGELETGPKLATSFQPLNRVPMWHRRGGLVVTAPVAQTVERQDWSTLTLELSPFGVGRGVAAVNVDTEGAEIGKPDGGAGAGTGPVRQGLSRRVVREGEVGDGTVITMTQTSSSREVGAGTRIQLGFARTHSSTPRRRYVVRVHLRPGETVRAPPSEATRPPAGGTPSAASSNTWRVIRPVGAELPTEAVAGDDGGFVPFGGAGTAPAGRAGSVFEATVAGAAFSFLIEGGEPAARPE